MRRKFDPGAFDFNEIVTLKKSKGPNLPINSQNFLGRLIRFATEHLLDRPDVHGIVTIRTMDEILTAAEIRAIYRRLDKTRTNWIVRSDQPVLEIGTRLHFCIVRQEGHDFFPIKSGDMISIKRDIGSLQGSVVRALSDERCIEVRFFCYPELRWRLKESVDSRDDRFLDQWWVIDERRNIGPPQSRCGPEPNIKR